MKKIKKNLTPKVERGGFQAKIVWRFIAKIVNVFGIRNRFRYVGTEGQDRKCYSDTQDRKCYITEEIK